MNCISLFITRYILANHNLDDVVFVGRHKTYGAYELRKRYPLNFIHGAIVIITLCNLVLIFFGHPRSLSEDGMDKRLILKTIEYPALPLIVADPKPKPRVKKVRPPGIHSMPRKNIVKNLTSIAAVAGDKKERQILLCKKETCKSTREMKESSKPDSIIIIGRSREIYVELGFQDEPLEEVFEQIYKASGFLLTYPTEAVRQYNSITVMKEKRTVEDLLNIILEPTVLRHRVMSGWSISIYKKEWAKYDRSIQDSN